MYISQYCIIINFSEYFRNSKLTVSLEPTRLIENSNLIALTKSQSFHLELLHFRTTFFRQSSLLLLLPFPLFIRILLLKNFFLLGSSTLLSSLRCSFGSCSVRRLQEGFLHSESIFIRFTFTLQ